MKKTLLETLILGIALSGISVFAENDVIIPSSPALSTVSHKYENEETMLPLRLSRMQVRGDNLIKERINSLTSNMQAITGDKSLQAEQKAALNLIIMTNITGLTALNVSIASSTTATSTKALISSIFTNFRIYGIVIPQVRIEKRIYDLQNHSIKLSDTFLKVQAKIDEAKGKGKDVTVWQKSLDDAKVLVAIDMNTLANLLTKIQALKPSDYGTTSKAIIESANSDLKSVLKDFNSVKKNLHRPNGLSNLSGKKDKDQKDEEHERKENEKYDKKYTLIHSPLYKTSWVWTSSILGGVATSAPAGEKFVLTFGENNRANSTTDCNGVGGSYVVGTGTLLSFGPFMSTMMYCEGSRENEYNQSLARTSSYVLSGTNLTLINASGTMMFMKK